jgi:proteasome lid subunit RPN8/RPN11
MDVVLDRALQQKIFAELEAAYPNEGSGFLLGALTDGALRVIDVVRVENVFAPEEQHHRFAVTPQDWARLEDEADARGLTLVGCYHSHPDSPAVPSTYDRDHALPNFSYLITSVQGARAVDMRAWWLREDRSQFDAAALQVT